MEIIFCVIPGNSIKYPDKVTILNIISNYSRVAAPLQKVTGDPKFKIVSKLGYKNLFGITKDGIVYVKSDYVLKHTIPAIYEIKIKWDDSGSATIDIHIKNASMPICKNDMSSDKNFCAYYTTKSDCESACGVGSPDLKCKWRQGPNLYTSNYTTCTSDLQTCSDQQCDGLEKLAYDKKIYVCPQDCVPENKKINLGSSKDGIRAHVGSNVCHCSEIGHCMCSAEISASTTNVPVTTKTPVPEKYVTPTFEINKDENFTEISISETEKSTYKASCDFHCVIYIVMFPSAIAAIVVTIFCMRKRYKPKFKENMLFEDAVMYNAESHETNFSEDINFDSNSNQAESKLGFESKWEFDRSKLTYDVILGEGEFGKVFKGYATNINGIPGETTVAVKTLKNASSSVEVLALLSECQLLQEVSHPNVIKMLGSCMKGDPPLVIIEYCSYGSLRNFLRIYRKIEESGADYVNTTEKITAKDILSFAWQISKGMAYLADLKLVHRDLAARNVLLAEGKICKISDFGLTR